jgi:hypothetical protein
MNQSEQLFEMLEQALENESLPEDEALEIMSKLSRGVNELDLQELDDLSVAGSEYQSSVYSDSESSYSPDLRATTTVQLPAYKTPYEVWEEKHKGDKQKLKAPVTLSKQREKDLISRLNESGRKKQELLALQQHKQIAEEIKNASFAPTINKKSRELNDQNQVRNPSHILSLTHTLTLKHTHTNTHARTHTHTHTHKHARAHTCTQGCSCCMCPRVCTSSGAKRTRHLAA